MGIGQVLDLVHRALKVAEKRYGTDHPEAAKLARMCQVLSHSRRYGAPSPVRPRESLPSVRVRVRVRVSPAGPCTLVVRDSLSSGEGVVRASLTSSALHVASSDSLSLSARAWSAPPALLTDAWPGAPGFLCARGA